MAQIQRFDQDRNGNPSRGPDPNGNDGSVAQKQNDPGAGGRQCRECDTPQFPKSDICVNPECGAFYSQDDYEFSDVPAKVKTFTGDMLAVSVDPPAIYGMVQFEGGGRLVADFTDCELDDIKVGLAGYHGI